jgi:hypothetical protein
MCFALAQEIQITQEGSQMANEPGKFRLGKGTSKTQMPVWVWTLTSDMGHEIARSEEFPDRETAERSIEWVSANAALCGVLDPPYTGPSVG